MSDEMKPQTEVYQHSHDPMYLVSHRGGGKEYPDYESCHHCSFISVPEIEKLQSRIKELEEKLNRSEIENGNSFSNTQRLVSQMNDLDTELAMYKGLVGGSFEEFKSNFKVKEENQKLTLRIKELEEENKKISVENSWLKAWRKSARKWWRENQKLNTCPPNSHVCRCGIATFSRYGISKIKAELDEAVKYCRKLIHQEFCHYGHNFRCEEFSEKFSRHAQQGGKHG